MRKLIVLFVGVFVLAAGQAEAQSKKTMALIKDLSDKTAPAAVRKAAAEELGELADVKITDAKTALPALNDALKDADPTVRKAVMEALGKIEPDKFPALCVDVLKKEKDGVVLITAANFLGQIGPPAKDALPVLLDAYKSSPQDAPKTVTKAPPPPPNAMPTDPPAVRRAILAAYARIQPDAKERIPFLLDAVKSEKDTGVQAALINELGQIGDPAKDAVPLLLEVQKTSMADAAKVGPKDNRDLDPQGVRRNILTALARLQPDPKDRVPMLVNAVKNDRDPQVRGLAVTGLSQIGAPAKSAIPALLEVHKSLAGADPQGLRRSIVAALSKLEPDPKESVPLYVEILKREKDAGARLAAVSALGDIGAPAKSAFPVLQEVYKSSPALPKMTDPQGVRRATVEAMAKLEPDPKDFVPALITIVKQDRDPNVRSAAVAALSGLGPQAKAAVQTLTDLSKLPKTATEADKALAKEAEAALEKINPK